ncbi:MAG: radical SAM protein [Deltaproteobacteria bacterium]|nr:radical SAM protein [Deltaproteobacteria bacterium]
MLKQAVVVPTWNCNLRCKFCEYGEKERKLSLTERDIELIADLYSPPKINLMGGEPLLYPLFDRTLEIFSGSSITVQTNGVLVPKKIKQLERVRQVILSIEGNQRYNDQLRGKGVFKAVIRAAKMLKERSIPVLFRSGISPTDLGKVKYLLKLSENYADGIYFYPLIGTHFSRDQMRWLFDLLSKYEAAWVDLPQFFCYLGVDGYCAAGRSRWCFLPTRTITPCQWITDYYLGEIGDDPSFVEENGLAFSRSKAIPEPCMTCEKAEVCMGGCRVTNWFSSCPLAHSVGTIILREDGGKLVEKARVIKKLLRGVVTC